MKLWILVFHNISFSLEKYRTLTKKYWTVTYVRITALIHFQFKHIKNIFSLSKKTYNISGSTLAPPTLPVAQYQVGDKTTQMIPPKSFWTSQFNQPDSKFVKFNLTVQDNGVFGIYGRRGASPSIAQFDFFDIVDGRTLSSRVKRSAKVKVCSKHCQENGQIKNMLNIFHIYM